MAELIRTETYGDAGASARIQELGAVKFEEHSEPGRQIYFSGRHDVWIVVTRVGRNIQLAIYEGCPC